MTTAVSARSEALEVLREFLRKYGPTSGPDGVVRYFNEVLGVTLDPWQHELAMAFGRGEPRIAVAACHGPGKTFMDGGFVWYNLNCRFPQVTVATAPSSGQLEDALIKEIMLIYENRLPEALKRLYEIRKNRIELRAAPDESFFSARTARTEKPEALQGIHMEGGFVTLMADEASGIDMAIFESAAGSMSGANTTTILTSNPVRGSGFFFDCFHRNKDMWATWNVSADMSSRVTDEFVEYIRRQFGEDSSAYQVRVLGQFPKADDDTVIPLAIVQEALERDVQLNRKVTRYWGLDVARFGDDDTVLIERSNLGVTPDLIKVWAKQDTMQTAGRVKSLWDRTDPVHRPELILIDVIGIGAGVVDRLRELGLPARGINAGEVAAFNDQYVKVRDELWFRGRSWLASKTGKLPSCEGGCARDCPHQRLADELTQPRFRYTSDGRIEVEPKKGNSQWGLKSRGFRSPNVADAFMLTFAGTVSGMVEGHDRRGTDWKKPLKRKRKRIV